MNLLNEDKTLQVNVYGHCCSNTFNNCYILGTDFKDRAAPHEAVIIDPGYLDESILKFIEDNEYSLLGVLVTHDHTKLQGIKSLKRIYNTEIFAVNQNIYGYKTVMIRDKDFLDIGPFRFEVMTVPGHTPDSVVFRFGHILFTGDVLSAGLVGYTSSAYSAATQMNALQSKIFSLFGDFTILPCHGPPSSLEAERYFNIGFRRYNQNKNRPRRLFDSF
ncbi:MAG: MBL fold metallo-hydrolase [Treponema sp.]|jgi:glyoxylase-like metal-dependent hydrolase (beta-lactamase superfamily II)|nr:MBL fold metallo-hydrolase [Treponema sp.]